MRVVVAGDVMVTTTLSDPATWDRLRWLADVLAGADAAFANFESVVHDYQWPPMASSGGTWMRTPQQACAQLKSLGFSLLSLANNHAGDYGPHALVNTLDRLADAGLVCAGAGRTLSQARAPAYLATESGRVGLVAATVDYPEHAAAADPLDPVAGRPGVHYLAHQTSVTVPPAGFLALSGAVRTVGGHADGHRIALAPIHVTLTIDQPYRRHDVIDQTSLSALLAAVRDAHARSDLTIASLHCHDPSDDPGRPTALAVTVCRMLIDAGADLVVGHGPHRLRPVEIYRGKPIFYGLGALIMQTPLITAQPPDAYRRTGTPPGDIPQFHRHLYHQIADDPDTWTAAVADLIYDRRALRRIRLIPVRVPTDPGAPGLGLPHPLIDTTASPDALSRIRATLQSRGVDATPDHQPGQPPAFTLAPHPAVEPILDRPE